MALGATVSVTADGVPINATLLFSWTDYEATAEAYLRGIERRVEAGLDPNIATASMKALVSALNRGAA